MKYQTESQATLWEHLAIAAPECSNTTKRDWIKLGRILVNGKQIFDSKTLVDKNIILSLGPKKKFITSQNPIDILFEDDSIIVVDKPSGLLSVDKDHSTEVSLHRLLKDRNVVYKPIYPYHRLDQGTSGVILFCKNKSILEEMQSARSESKRLYEALVEGHIPYPEGVWNHYLKEVGPYHVYVTNELDGKICSCNYKVLKKEGSFTRIEVSLTTGRKNQIRVQSAKEGYPVVGDRKYGATSDPLRRIALHAKLLCITHPLLKKRMTFESKTPF